MVGAGVLVQPLLGLPHWAGVVHRRRGRDLHRRDGRHGLDDMGAVHQGLAAGRVQHRADRDDSRPRLRGRRPSPPSRASRRIVEDGRDGHSRASSNGQAAARQRAHEQGHNSAPRRATSSRLPDGVERPARSARWRSSAPSSRARSCLDQSETTATPTARPTTTFYAEADARQPRSCAPASSPTFKGIRGDKLFDKLELPLADARPVLRHGVAAAHPDPLLHGQRRGGRPQEHDRRHRVIGFFYVLTLYMGLGAMTSGALDLTDTNMAAPLLARSFSELLFAVISAIAFTTVLGTVSGLILAASRRGVARPARQAPASSLDRSRARCASAKIASVGVGIVAMVLGIVFEKLNVTFLVGWAFSVAASREPAVAGDAAVLERHDQAGHHRRGHRRHGQFARRGSCSAARRSRTSTACPPTTAPRAVQPARHRHDPARFRRARGRLAAHATTAAAADRSASLDAPPRPATAPFDRPMKLRDAPLVCRMENARKSCRAPST